MNFEAIYHYFTFKNIPTPLTAFKGIESLLPGEMLIFCRGQLTKKKWWTIHFQEIENPNEEDIQRKILELLEDSTKLRMISDVPFGAYLSGGVDSSVIVALMTRYSDQPIKTFSLGYEDELKNKEADLYYAPKYRKPSGRNITSISCPGVNYVTMSKRLLWLLPALFWDDFNLFSFQIDHEACQSGPVRRCR